MVQDGTGGGGAVAHIAVVEGTDEHFVDVSNQYFPKGRFCLIVLVEGGGGDNMGIAKVGDMGGHCNIWDGGVGVGVERINEGRVRE